MSASVIYMKKSLVSKVAGIGILFLVGLNLAYAQEVKSTIDRDTIKIGEQITYKVEVETDQKDRVVFPSGQSFLPLEVIDSLAVDTFLTKNRVRLTREYPLTQFDSGSYTIPKQTIIVNEKGFYTDTFEIRVNDVVVDTTKQQLFPIKPPLDIRKAMSMATWLWWILGLVILGILVYLFLRARKKIIEKKKLSPLEKALESLNELDESAALEQQNIKEFYTVLSDALKRYVDEKIDDRAMESTTAEFIDLLRNYKKKKQLYLKGNVIDGLEAILKRADLVKFAGIATDKLTAREDRQTVEEQIKAFEQAIPEPTEEERMQDAAYRMAFERRQRQKKLIFRSLAGFVVVLLAVTVFVSIKGLDYAKGLVYTQPTEKMLRTEWIKSEYGTFGMTLSTPEVLVRQMDSVSKIFPNSSETEENFTYGSIRSNFYVKFSNVRFKKSAKIDSLDIGQLLDKALGDTEISNMTFKNQEFKTLKNEQGQKVFGNFFLENPGRKTGNKRAYTFILFTERGGLQELLITYDPDDRWAKEIEERLANSVEFNKEKDG